MSFLHLLAQANSELVMFGLVTKMRRALPILTGDVVPVICGHDEDGEPPVIVTVVDHFDSRFKVFLMNRYAKKQLEFSVYESSTDALRGLGNPLLELGIRVGEFPGRILRDSTVFF